MIRLRRGTVAVLFLALLCCLFYWAKRKGETRALRDVLRSLRIPVVRSLQDISKTTHGEEAWYNLILWRSATYTELAETYKTEMLNGGWRWRDEDAARAVEAPRPPILPPIRMENKDFTVMITFNPPIGDPDEKGIDEIIIVLAQKDTSED